MRAIRKLQHVVEEPVFLIPQSHAIVAAVAHRVRDVNEMLPEFAGDVFIAGSSLASSSAMASMFKQYMAIQLVPSDCSR